jgi:mono/diheme cytochrome c family protein
MTARLRTGLLSASLGLTLLAAACGGTPAATPTRPAISAANVIATATVKAGGTPGGAPAAGGSPGAQLFAAQGCNACHMVKGQGGAVGPNLSTIGTQAATRKPGMSAADYLRESIINPNAFIVQGYQAGVMPGTYGQTLSNEQLDQLVAYLLEQK